MADEKELMVKLNSCYINIKEYKCHNNTHIQEAQEVHLPSSEIRVEVTLKQENKTHIKDFMIKTLRYIERIRM